MTLLELVAKIQEFKKTHGKCPTRINFTKENVDGLDTFFRENPEFLHFPWHQRIAITKHEDADAEGFIYLDANKKPDGTFDRRRYSPGIRGFMSMNDGMICGISVCYPCDAFSLDCDPLESWESYKFTGFEEVQA